MGDIQTLNCYFCVSMLLLIIPRPTTQAHALLPSHTRLTSFLRWTLAKLINAASAQNMTRRKYHFFRTCVRIINSRSWILACTWTWKSFELDLSAKLTNFVKAKKMINKKIEDENCAIAASWFARLFVDAVVLSFLHFQCNFFPSVRSLLHLTKLEWV